MIGWPVEHSRSPLIHEYWIRQLGLEAEYRREAVPPDRFADFIAHLADHGYVGANVTVPHKEAALALSAPDALAEAVGAANTLWRDGGVLRSTNTDVEGFVASLDAGVAGLGERRGKRGRPGRRRRRARHRVRPDRAGRASHPCRQPQLGSGGRDAAALRRPGGAVRLGAADDALAGAGLLVNTTTLGMAGQPPLEIELAPLPATAVVADIVYAPLVTPLLAAAGARGLRTVDGLGMLLHQAVGAFARFFGVRPQVTQGLRTLVEADLMRAATLENDPEGPRWPPS